jgi:hypothetical protein
LDLLETGQPRLQEGTLLRTDHIDIDESCGAWLKEASRWLIREVICESFLSGAFRLEGERWRGFEDIVAMVVLCIRFCGRRERGRYLDTKYIYQESLK